MYWSSPLPGETSQPLARSMLEGLPESVVTPRLELRSVERRDLDDLMAINSDDETTRFLTYATWRSRDDADDWYDEVVAHRDDGRSRHLALVDRDDGRVVDRVVGRVVGILVVFNPEPVDGRLEVGYVLGARDRGRGLMREALEALLIRCFEDLGELRRIEAFVDPRNVASDRLLRSLGFVHEGRLRARRIFKGEVVDSDAYGLLRTDRTSSLRERR